MVDALGLGDGFSAWVSTLLHDTRAAALFCGTLSTPHAFAAGVHQGCPLSPTLYLCVATALHRFLQRRRAARGPVGVSLCGYRFDASQYADDLVLFEAGAEAVPALLADFDVFGAAT